MNIKNKQIQLRNCYNFVCNSKIYIPYYCTGKYDH